MLCEKSCLGLDQNVLLLKEIEVLVLRLWSQSCSWHHWFFWVICSGITSHVATEHASLSFHVAGPAGDLWRWVEADTMSERSDVALLYVQPAYSVDCLLQVLAGCRCSENYILLDYTDYQCSFSHLMLLKWQQGGYTTFVLPVALIHNGSALRTVPDLTGVQTKPPHATKPHSK